MRFFKSQPQDDDLVKLAVFSEPCAAHSLRILLEAHGIATSVTGEESNALGGTALFESGLVAVQVHVRRQDFDEAKLIMEEVPAASETLIPEWICQCGEQVDRGFSVCWSCGNQYDDDPDTE